MASRQRVQVRCHTRTGGDCFEVPPPCGLSPRAVLSTPHGATPQAAQPDIALITQATRGLALREIGPALMGGRIADIAVHPDDPTEDGILRRAEGLRYLPDRPPGRPELGNLLPSALQREEVRTMPPFRPGLGLVPPVRQEPNVVVLDVLRSRPLHQKPEQRDVASLQTDPRQLFEAVREPLAEHLGGEHHFRLGGGTALAMRWGGHRHSTDVDLFTDGAAYARLYEQRASFERELERRGIPLAAVRLRSRNLKILLLDSEVTLFSGGPMIPGLPPSGDTVRGTHVPLEGTAEILARILSAAPHAAA